ncbi:MBL fold metallo-hydrolase [Microbacterium sp. STN6]|uniref:MBL fold metallo-hydrolase n=1 Tax=Microbacterium sp. STN6 TaxID=2995588 RepID=UPI002260EF47|nr:MBL fold metallo-hydrolase [Microbacterium sp. STN6]MCX7521439.1 MBL fold metallo-hydrolase [Microbacterium sp. STN6]
MTVWICKACGVERDDTDAPPLTCPICLDERQYVPKTGQEWLSLDELRSAGTRVNIAELEPGLFGITSTPAVGIGQTALLVTTPAGNLLWDPTGYIDDEGARRVRELGGVAAIIASHPHMYGVQVEWSRAFDDAPVYVAEVDRDWVQRESDGIRSITDAAQVLPGVTVHRIGGHFAGSLVAHWPAGADGRGVLLAGDAIFPGPDGRTVSFLRSYPNRLPLSAAVVDRLARSVEPLAFDRLYNNFASVVERDAKAVVRGSADRYMAWVRGDFDHLT